ncbi:piezo-type mechanosensitive ion channel like protein [Quercus suber]|uniref:Piezo-type mechanosensitive ion channel like protein n=1 Tax=Quercus suber TaxID=58331 RepID=A0AAW0JSN4_QUESU
MDLKLGPDQTGLAGCGGLLRDCHGNWISGFARAIGHTSSLAAELWAIRDGLTRCCHLSLQAVVVEVDASVAVSLLSQDVQTNGEFSSLIDDCRNLMKSIHQVQLKHCFREANRCADAIAKFDKMGLTQDLSGRLTLYQTTLCEKIPWDKFNDDIDLDPQSFWDTYNENDIQLICCQADASILWLVPSVVQTRFIQSLDWDTDMDIIFTWVLTRDRPKGKEVVKYERTIDPVDLPMRSDVQKVLNGSMNSFRIYNVYPRYFRVTGSGDVRPLELEEISVNADLIINRANYEWWSFNDVNSSGVTGCGEGIIGDTLSKFSIWGLYITFVLAVGRFIRLQCSDLRMRIPYENLPSCDRLIAICEDIYAARAEGELGVEEVLYWTLVKIYRSPHMLLEYTKID